MRRFPAGLVCAALSVLAATGGAEPPTSAPATAATTEPAAVLIHLPGIAGEMNIDRALVAGLIAGGIASDATIVDWTGTDRGVPALTNVARHHEQAKLLAERLTTLARSSPARPIVLTAHSGGTGVAVEALEQLPADVKVQTLVLLASALSPSYDLTNALRHVTGRAVSLHSSYDSIVLGTGTRTFGTYDRVWSDAAGYVGFTQPTTADAAEYAKLVQYPYDPAWMKFGNFGDHIGATNRRFAKEVLAKLINRPIGSTP